MYSKERNFFKRGARIFAITLIFLSSAMSPFAVSCSASPFSGGNGSKESPYLITGARDLDALSEHVFLDEKNADGTPYTAAHYLQTADIDLSSLPAWLPIGPGEELAFCGVYDGAGYTISNIPSNFRKKSRKPENAIALFDHFGLFGMVSGDAVETGILQNIHISVPILSRELIYEGGVALESFGAIAGSLVGGKVKNCTTQGMMVYSLFENALPSGPNTFIGGIVGNVQNGVVENCENKMKLVVNHYMFSQQFVGGIVGRVDGILQNCRNEADFLIGGGNEIVFGELAGILSGGKLINCFSDKDKSYARVGKVSGGNILIDPPAPKSSRP